MLKSLAQLQRHTRRVLITKRLLPVFAFLLIAMIIIWPLFKEQKNSFSLGISPSTNGKGAKMDMENIRFFGVNTKQLPITMTAPVIEEINPETHQLRMKNPVATYQMANNETLTGKAPYALVFQNKEILFFEDKIDITSTSGYTITTSEVTCDYNKGVAESDAPVSIKGPMGSMSAEGLWIASKGNLILFKKDVLATIYQKNEQIKLSSPYGIQINQGKHTLTTLGQTTVYHQGNILKADKVLAYYTNDKNNRIEKVVATGNVSIDNGKQKMAGEKGIYYPAKRQMFMEGNVALTQGRNRITGEKATLDLVTGESDLKTSGRITGQLVPNELKEREK